jgi:hypothetical protein
MRKLKERGMYGNQSTNSPDYLPKLATDYKLLDGVSKKQFRAAMHALVMDNRIKLDEVGTYRNRNPRLGLVEVE